MRLIWSNRAISVGREAFERSVSHRPTARISVWFLCSALSHRDLFWTEMGRRPFSSIDSRGQTHLMLARRSFWKLVGKWVFGISFVLAGINHFRSPAMYMKIMPPYLPWHRPLVLLSGVFEIALGALLLIPRSSRLAAWGLIALLIAIFPANVYLYQHQEIFPGPPVLHLLRLPLQAVLIWWAWIYTKRD